METVNDLSTRLPTANQSRTQSSATTGDLYTPPQRELINYFFTRLMNIYGARFHRQFASDAAVKAAKVEWGTAICGYGRDQLHAKLEVVKGSNDDALAWPNIAAILQVSTSASPNGINAAAYREPELGLPQLPDWATKERSDRLRKETMANLKSMLD